MLRPWIILTFLVLLCAAIAVVALWPSQERESAVTGTLAVTSPRTPEKEEGSVSPGLAGDRDAGSMDSATDSVVDEETLLSKAYWSVRAEKVKHEVIALRKKYVELEKTHGEVIRKENGKKIRVLIYDEEGEPCALLRYYSSTGTLFRISEYRILESQKKIDAQKNGFAPNRAVPHAGAVQHGYSVSYNRAGLPTNVDQWVDNTFHGTRYFYTPDGDVRYVVEMVGNNSLGADVEWDKDGNLMPGSRILTEPKPFIPPG